MPSESTNSTPCADDSSPYPDDFASLASAVADHGDDLRRLPNVVGVGVGYKVIGGVETHRRCITVFVNPKVPASQLEVEDCVPTRFHLHLTDVIEAASPARCVGDR